MLKKIHLLTNFSFFDFKEIDNSDKSKIFSIEQKFYKISRSNDINKLFSNSDNNSLFYQGLEPDAEKKANNFWMNNCNEIYKIINTKNFTKKSYVKTYLSSQKGKGYRLLSLLIEINKLNLKETHTALTYSGGLNEDIGEISFTLFYLFPISFSNFH